MEGHTAHTAERARKELSTRDRQPQSAQRGRRQMQTRWYTLEHFTSLQGSRNFAKKRQPMAVSFVGEVGEVGDVVDAEKVV